MTAQASFREVIRNHPDREEVKSLHRAFLTRCLFFPQETYQFCLGLAIRSSQMGLPFHLPLYQSLAMAIAQHAQSVPSKKLKDLGRAMFLGLERPVDASFFDKPLLALVKQNKLKDAVLFVQYMQERYGSVDMHTAIDIMAVLHEQLVGDEEQEEDLKKWVEDAAELVQILKDPLVRQLEEQPTMTNRMNQRLEMFLRCIATEEEQNWDDAWKLMDRLPPDDEEEEDEDDDDEYSSDEELYDEDENFELASIVLNPHSGQIENMAFLSPNRRTPQEHDALVRDFVYVRDYQTWELPDVTKQFLDMGKDVLYSREYETYLLQQLEDDDYDTDDEDEY
eukprot:CAMPEP_0118676082 /NCGR_PEP_ID=MMETSP0800-20121206/1833_1 /TAXON_ID=210618 ORGANISM="Striatella unipunctata, Strain CCMP2910" /NCGR_SAMPLE_ID=MMETSP0800 /ASSEMBLY_ACC=CAM_ASM_000638 /LENGTH=335 /DNA_ID=CAMNT_0006571523 /DNA_START=15 /DNA_END=1022 /DNA_ORIENTATION=-